MSLEASGGKSKMQWQNPAQQNSVYKLHMISKLWASSCWGFLQIIPFWLCHASAGKVWVTSSQLVLRCSPCFRSTIIKSYLSFGKKLFFIPLLLGNWLLLLVPPACSHSWGNWRFHVAPVRLITFGHRQLLPLPGVTNSLCSACVNEMIWGSWRWPETASLCCHNWRGH